MCACLCARICVCVHACIRVVCGWVCVVYVHVCEELYQSYCHFQDKLKEKKIGSLYGQMGTMWPTHKVDKIKQESQWPALSGTLFTSSTGGYAFQQGDPSFMLEVALSCSSETSVNAQRAVFLWVCPHKGRELLSSVAHNTADPCSIRDGLSGTYRLPASYRDLADFHGQSVELLKAALHRKTGPRRRGGYTSRGGIIDMHSHVERHRGPGVQQAEPRNPQGAQLRHPILTKTRLWGMLWADLTGAEDCSHLFKHTGSFAEGLERGNLTISSHQFSEISSKYWFKRESKSLFVTVGYHRSFI